VCFRDQELSDVWDGTRVACGGALLKIRMSAVDGRGASRRQLDAVVQAAEPERSTCTRSAGTWP